MQYDSNIDRFLDLHDCLEITKLGKSAWYRLIKEGKAPAPIKIGRKSVWSLNQVQQFMHELKDAA